MKISRMPAIGRHPGLKGKTMKILVISDIHGYYDGLRAVWKQERDADAILVLGDIVDWGFNPHECVQFCREHNVIAISGNHDLSILDAYDRGVRMPEDGSPYTFAELTLERLTRDDLDYLRALPTERYLTLDGMKICMRHYPMGPETEMHTIEKAAAAHNTINWADKEWKEMTGEDPNHFENRVFIHGHTHQCRILLPGCGYTLLNPGSLAYRVCADSCAKGATYLTIESGVVFPHEILYPTEHLLKMIDEQNFKPEVEQPVRVYMAPQAKN